MTLLTTKKLKNNSFINLNKKKPRIMACVMSSPTTLKTSGATFMLMLFTTIYKETSPHYES